nr:restriction endonuclease [Pseudomonas weihenstephanensis]
MVIASLAIGQGGPGDAGIDGIMSLDKLGLGKVYVQAKRWRIMRWSRHHNCSPLRAHAFHSWAGKRKLRSVCRSNGFGVR